MTTTINLSKNEFHAIASMISVTAPKDHIAALTMVQLTANLDGSLTLIASNRMVIGEQNFMPYAPVSLTNDEPLTILLSPNMLKAMKATKYDGALVIGDVAITFSSYGGSSLNEPLPKDKMPDLSTYLPSAIDFDMIRPNTNFSRVNLDLLAQVSKLRTPSDSRTDNPVFDLYTQEMGDSGRPKPLIVTRAARSLMAVIQPMYVK